MTENNTQTKQTCNCPTCFMKSQWSESYKRLQAVGADKKLIAKMRYEDNKRLICLRPKKQGVTHPSLRKPTLIVKKSRKVVK